MTGQEVVSLWHIRSRSLEVPSRNPLVMRWRRMAQDPYVSPGFRSALNTCARELELAERGELDVRYEDDSDEDGVS